MLIRAIRRFREKTLEQYKIEEEKQMEPWNCLLYTSPSPRDTR